MKAIVAISDTHFGSNVAITAKKFRDDNGTVHEPSKFQAYLLRCWYDFWDNFVPAMTAGAERVVLVHNGDMIEGQHHDAVDLLPNIKDQEVMACEMMTPIARRFDAFYMVRGTEAHGGVNEQCTERIARTLGCPVDEDTGQYSRWQVWLDIGKVFQFAHHIGGTSSAAYETSAPMRELVAGLVEVAQWGQRLPDVFVRSHRHRFVPISIPSVNGRIQLIVTPGWQLRTPHVEKIDRMRLPHIGGVVFTVEDGICQVREKIYKMPKPKVIRI